LPTDLDITIPDHAYYFYYYNKSLSPDGIHPRCEIGAQDHSLFSNWINGAIFDYRIYYVYDLPSFSYGGITGKKLNDHWYIYYTHSVIEQPDVPTEKNSWPGGS